ncbi:O-antigen ligase family protein [Polaribacter sp. Hel1_85]|uniref:O-antigen ligase family protein n=1 Tax=Polaribacter sp. Hel1_85 TaxID=1250005 RepID=UPI00052B6BDA|nr:O-antigen ligase family protein [Polaribacter sp. Hel1_85]KGL62082.1 putative membrane protein, O-antigen ligase-related protein [Polaribacter sp. Hel1_85]
MKNKISLKISTYSYLLLMFFLPISLLLDNIFLIIMFLSTLFNVKKVRDNKVTYYLLAFYLFILFNGLLNYELVLEKENYIKLLPFLLIPFCLENIDNEIKLKGLFFLFISIIIIQVNSVYGIINYYYFTEGKKYALKNYSKINEILNYERPYLGFFSALNIIICFYFFSIKRKRFLSILIAVFSLILIIVISARLAIIVVFFTGVIIFFKEISRRKVMIALFVLIGTLLIVLLSDSSLKERFNQIGNDARVVTWNGAIHSFNNTNKYVFGSGSGQKTRIDLLEYYKNYEGFISQDEKNRFISKNYNTHNQYLNELLRGGFIGFFLLLIPQIILLYFNFKKNNVIGLMFLIAIMSFSLVENILDRQVGVYLYALLLSLTRITYKVKE